MSNGLNEFDDERRKMLSQWAKSDGTTIEEHNRALKERAKLLLEWGYIEQNIYDLLCKACDYHDLGKANPRMQQRLRNTELHFDPEKEIPHNILSMYLIPRENPEEYYVVLFAVGFHHDYGDVFQILGEPQKQILAGELLAEWSCAKAPGVRALKDMKSCITKPELCNTVILVKGLLHKCDYAASGNTEVEYQNDFLSEKTASFFERHHYRMNDMQKFCLENQDDNIMLVGQTGMGKTEAALLWIGNHKGFLFLPVKTAINKMYDRLREDILSDENDHEIEKRLGLLHSDAVSKMIESHRTAVIEPDSRSGAAQKETDVMEYHARSRQLALPLTISTVDQLFDFIFQYQTYELKLATLSYSKIVIDEIQMYGADLLADLIYGMKMIHQTGGKIAISTATLAPFVKDLIEEEVGKFAYGVFCDGKQVRHRVKLIPAMMSADLILEKFKSCLQGEKEAGHSKEDGIEAGNNSGGKPSGKILVICNTIIKAQAMYHDICQGIGEEYADKVYLLHSRFIRRDRTRKENAICQCGKTEHEETVIWISTSLVEASLDIDFDYLFTELQDLPSLLQRMGRVNRKGRKEISGFNCYIYTEVEERYLELPGIYGKSGAGNRAAFIDGDIFRLSKQVLKDEVGQNREGLLSEESKLRMINYFTTDNMSQTNYMRKYREQMERLRRIVWYEWDKRDVRIRDDIYTKDIIPYDIYMLYCQEIEASASRIRSKKTSTIEKIEERNAIMQYTVPVPQFVVNDYWNAVRKRTPANVCNPVKIGVYEEIPVIDCDYDEKAGFREKDFFKMEQGAIFV